ncbi:MAG TPA: hypothetical protein VGK48_19335 [Terriglobia bacterium]|jgi:hypothetical protein
MKFLKLSAATGISLLTGLSSFAVFGVMLPIWSMILIHGRHEVQYASADGGIISLTLPVVGAVVLIALFPFGAFVYRKLSH